MFNNFITKNGNLMFFSPPLCCPVDRQQRFGQTCCFRLLLQSIRTERSTCNPLPSVSALPSDVTQFNAALPFNSLISCDIKRRYCVRCTAVRCCCRRTGVACNGSNAAVVVKRDRLTSTEHYQNEIDTTRSTHLGD